MPGVWPTDCGRPGRRSTSRPRARSRLNEAERDRIADALRLAQRLGGEVGDHPRAGRGGCGPRLCPRPTTSPISSSPNRGAPRWREVLLGSLRSATDPPRRRHQHPCHRGAARTPRRAAGPDADKTERTAISLAIPGLSGEPAGSWRRRSASGWRCSEFLAVSNIALVFLTAILVGAIGYGLWPSLFACVVSVLAYNFFFLPPLYTFTIADPENVVALFFFAVVALIASNLAARMRGAGDRRPAARQDHRGSLPVQPQARRRGDPGRSALGDGAPDRADAQGPGRAAAAAKMGRVTVRAGFPPEDSSTRPISPRPNGAGRTTMRPAAAPIRCPAPSGCSCRCTPGAGRSASSASTATKPGPLLTPDQQRLLDALADQAALAIERVNLGRDSTARGWRPRPTGCARPC